MRKSEDFQQTSVILVIIDIVCTLTHLFQLYINKWYVYKLLSLKFATSSSILQCAAYEYFLLNITVNSYSLGLDDS